jgi:S1-C subfamily serine protease
MRRFFLVMFLGGCAFTGGLVAVALGPRLPSMGLAQQPTTPTVILPAPVTDVVKLGDRFEAVARRVSPAVVALEATKPADSGTKSKAVEESGSGVIVRLESKPGYYVLTNNHVITHAKVEQITVNLADGRVVRPAQVWADPESDIAVLRLDGIENAPTALLGDSEQTRVGQWVLAVGSPFGLNQTVTHGIISARERGQVSLGSTIRIKDFLQTDAAINPGSSGGPLVNLDGEVIGINTAIASQSGGNSGVAFSIPINLVKRVTADLLEKGSVSRGYLGVQLAGVFEPADALKLGLDRAQGAVVEAVYPDTPASAAGLKINDVILQLDGAAVRNDNFLINSISNLPPGRRIRLQVWRDRKAMLVDAVVGDWSKAQTRFRTGP